jgi:hypothetical protein
VGDRLERYYLSNGPSTRPHLHHRYSSRFANVVRNARAVCDLMEATGRLDLMAASASARLELSAFEDRIERVMGSAGGATPGSICSPREVAITVPEYFAVRRAIDRGESVVKAAVLRSVAERLPGRTEDAVSYKFQNVSAVLHDLGLPWVPGWPPASHSQDALEEAVLDWLDSHPEDRDALERKADEAPVPRANPTLASDEEVPPPPPSKRDSGAASRPAETTVTRRAASDAANTELGRRGEEWVWKREQAILRQAGRPDLAGQVRWVARDDGDGAGYDVRSYTSDGHERWIEVKTTKGGIRSSFYLSSHEREVWEQEMERYELHRVFEFATRPRFYRLTGMPEDTLVLKTAQWLARLR